ncbi:cation diffusion facilitator family transporter [Corallincola platygyrae]|uniref:Cation diffusion facilitator family transporter n=1 Tax=Corallincola platygyrae TaxID=1193278 RepID=A0ABW4XJW3_9GAMM
MALSHESSTEQLSLRISLYATIAMVVLGISFGLWTGSFAIFLDGLFSLFSTAMTGLGLITSYLLTRNEDRRFQFGYAYIEPLATAINGTAILVMCLGAGGYAIFSLYTGGQSVAMGVGLIYALCSSLLCWSCCGFMRRQASRSNSLLLDVDSQEWFVDAMLSSVVLLGFVLGYLLSSAGISSVLPYIDPVLTLLLSSAAMVMPIRVLSRSIKDIVSIAPDNEFSRGVPPKLATIKREFALKGYRHYLSRSGRRYDLEINFLVDSGNAPNLHTQDRIRHRLWQQFSQEEEDLWLTISFTVNPKWL